MSEALDTTEDMIKPNGAILSYPVITAGEYTHYDSCVNILGMDKIWESPYYKVQQKEFDNAFRFLENTFGQGQELVIFVTEITAGYDTSWFVENFGCDAYFRHNRELLFDDTRRRIHNKIAAAKAAEFDKNGQ